MKYLFILPVLVALAIVGATEGGHAQDEVSSQAAKQPQTGESLSLISDCTKISVEYADNTSLTREEKIAHMDEAFFDSLSKFDACQQAQTTQNSAGGVSNAASGVGGASGGGGSVASSELSGTTPPQDQNVTSVDSSESVELSDNKQRDISLQSGASLTAEGINGKLPDDIPPADNDSVLEAQIRHAAINEKNSVIKAKLWNEYRKYKGLPIN